MTTYTHKCKREGHGEYTTDKEKAMYWKDCPLCVAEEIENERKFAEIRNAEMRASMIEQRYRTSGIPDRFKDKRMSDYVATTTGQNIALEFAKTYANEFDVVSKSGRCAIFCGQPGTGKTHLATAICHHVIENYGTVKFTTVQRIVRAVKESWRKESTQTESEIMNICADVSLLVIDEVGVQFGSDFEKNLIFDIMNDRYEDKKPTILISNLSPKEVVLFLGERVFDRLREDGGVCVPFDWESNRGK